MQDEHGLLEPHRIDGAVGSTGFVLDDFKDPGISKTLERLRRRMLLARLGKTQGKAEEPSYSGWELEEIFSAAADPGKRTFDGHLLIYELV